MKYLLIQKQNEKLRNPNIDLIRILGMLAIIIHHLLWHGKVLVKYSRYKELQILNIICMWHVASFGIISGLVGQKKPKFSNLFYLWIQSIFYSIIFCIYYNGFNGPFYKNLFVYNLFPVIHKIYWYFTAYFGIYPFLPFINTGTVYLSQIELKKVIYFMIGIFIIWASYFNDSFALINGKSPFSLLIFYILGEYMGKYYFKRTNNRINRILIYFLCLIIFGTVSIISYKVNYKNSPTPSNIKFKKLFRIGINSLPMILQVFCITIFISQIKFNKSFSNVISFIAPLTFDVYLIHENPYVRNTYIINSFKNNCENEKLSYINFLICKKSLFIFFICIFIGFMRYKLFKILRIKQICVYYESINTKILNFFF